jgi:hypothetical protein
MDGSYIIGSVEISGKNVREHVFHEKRTVIGAGESPLNVGQYRGLRLEIFGDAADRKLEFKGRMFSGQQKGIFAQNVSTGEWVKETENNSDYIYIMDITGFSEIVIPITSISSGSITVKAIVTVDPPQFVQDAAIPKITTAINQNLINSLKGGTNYKESRVAGPLAAGSNVTLLDIRIPIKMHYIQLYFKHESDTYAIIETFEKSGAINEYRRALLNFSGSDPVISALALRETPVSFMELKRDDKGANKFVLATPSSFNGTSFPYGCRIRVYNSSKADADFIAMARYYEVV